MPKPMLGRPQTQTHSENILSATPQYKNTQATQVMNKMQLDRLLRQPRSKEYMEAIHKLDAGGHVHNHDKVKNIIDAIRQEFPDVEIAGILLGVVSTCYLGDPYEVHALDITGDILEHYRRGEIMPGGLEKARALALRGGYEFIEVYVDCCRCIGSNGSVSVVSC